MNSIIHNNNYSSDWSPSITHDGVRSEITNAQGGGPANTSYVVCNTIPEKPQSEMNTTRRHVERSKNKSIIDDIFEKHSGKFKLQQ